MSRLPRIVLSLFLAILAAPAIAQAPRVVLFEDPALDASRLHYPLLITEGRGYRIRCASQEAEEAVIRGLGFTSVPSAILTAVDPEIAAAAPGANPLLCPQAADFQIKVFAFDHGQGLKHYLQFPAEPGSTTVTDRLYTPGCVGLVEALGLDLAAAIPADPTPFFQGKIHNIVCLSGAAVNPVPTDFAGWCTKSDRTPGQTATVMALLDATPGGISAVGSPTACAAAQSFLVSIPSLNLNGRAVQDLAPLRTLPHLTSLSLADNAISDIAPLSDLRLLTFLDISGNQVVGLAALAPLTLLNRLDVADNQIADIRALSALAALSNLTLDGNAIADLAPLQFLQALSGLSIARNALTGDMLEPLTALGGLQSLDLSFNNIETFATLGSFPSTLEIDLTGNPIVSSSGQTFLDLCILHRDAATPFGQTVRALIAASGAAEEGATSSCQDAADALAAITTLDLSSKILSDIRPLAVLTHLTSLNLSGNAITDATALEGLVELTSLNLSGNAITDITPIAPLTKLSIFDASGNPVALDSFLSGCLMRNHAGLLSPAQMAEVGALLDISAKPTCGAANNGLKSMTFANAQGRGLSTVAYFKVFENLTSLDLSNNDLTDVSELTRIPGLTSLWVRNNPISSVISLLQLRRLETLALDGTLVSSLNGIANLSKLKRIYFSNTNVRSVRPLETLPLLEDAGMRNLPLNYDSFVEYCLVNRFDSVALGNDRAFMAALDARLQAESIDTADCDAAEGWVRTATVLTMNKKSIISVRPIIFFTALRELHLFDNLISDAAPIASLTQLTKLNLASNRLSTVPRFASGGLRELFLNDNTIELVPNITNMGALTNVGLSNNRLRDARPLATLPALSVSDLRSNRLPDNITVPEAIWSKIYLGDNPICQSFFTLHPAVQAACDRKPNLFLDVTIHHLGDAVLTTGNGTQRTVLCPNPDDCPVVRLRPGNFDLIVPNQ